MLITPNMWTDVVKRLKDSIGYEHLPKDEQERVLPKIEAAAREAIRDHGKPQSVDVVTH